MGLNVLSCNCFGYKKKVKINDRGMPSLKLRNHPSMVPVIRVDSYGSDAPRSVDSVRSPPSITHFAFPGRSYSFDTGREATENGLLPISYRSGGVKQILFILPPPNFHLLGEGEKERNAQYYLELIRSLNDIVGLFEADNLIQIISMKTLVTTTSYLYTHLSAVEKPRTTNKCPQIRKSAFVIDDALGRWVYSAEVLREFESHIKKKIRFWWPLVGISREKAEGNLSLGSVGSSGRKTTNFDVSSGTIIIDEEFSPCDLYLRPLIEESKVTMLLDTGAAISLMKEDLAIALREKYPDAVEIYRLKNPVGTKNVDGTSCGQVEACADVHLTSPQGNMIPFRFYLSKSIQNQAILGGDRLKKYKAAILYETMSLCLREGAQRQYVLFPLVEGAELDENFQIANITPLIELEPPPPPVKDILDLDDPDKYEEVEIRNALWRKLVVAQSEGRVSIDEAIEAFVRMIPYSGVFRDELGRFNGVTPPIRIKAHTPWREKTYPIASVYADRARIAIKKMEKDGIIKRSSSEFVNPLVVALKSSGDIRICIDAFNFNAIVEPQRTEPPTVYEQIFNDRPDRYLSSFDFAQGFLQIEISTDVSKYLAFQFEGQVYEYVRLPFGTSISPSVFIEVVNGVLRDIIGPHVQIYVDDVLVTTHTFKEHVGVICDVLRNVFNAGMTLSLKKTNLFVGGLKHLGFLLGGGMIGKDEKKFVWFDNFEKQLGTKTNERGIGRRIRVKQIQSLLGFSGYYHCFIDNYANIVQPLRGALLGAKNCVVWSQQMSEAYEKLKRAFCSRFALVKPDFMREFIFHAGLDDRGENIRSIVTQRDDSGAERVVLFYSKALSRREREYTPVEKNLYALYACLTKLRVLLYGRVIVVNSRLSEALRWARKLSLYSGKIATWLITINSFNLRFELPTDLKTGIRILEMDSVPEVTIIDDEEGEERVIESLISSVNVNYFGVVEPAHVRDAIARLDVLQLNDRFCSRIKEELRKDQSKYKQDYYIEDGTGILFRVLEEGDCAVPVLPQHLANDFIEYIHTFYGHPGAQKTITVIKRFVWWKGVSEAVKRYTRTCLECRYNKISNQKLIPEFASVVATQPGQVVAVDLFGPLPKSKWGYTVIIVFKDICTGFVWAYGMRNANALSCVKRAKMVVSDIQTRGEQVGTFLSDNGPQFRSRLWAKCAKELGIKLRHITPYHPQSNPVERTMRELGKSLRIFLNNPTRIEQARGECNHKRWAPWLKDTVDSMNDLPGRTEVYSPNELWQIKGTQNPFSGLNPKNISFDVAINKLKKKLTTSNVGDRTSSQFLVDENEIILAYTDGGCLRNHQVDSLGATAVWFGEDHALNYSKLYSRSYCTNNEMELFAMYEALLIAKAGEIKKLSINTDSKYAIHQIEQYSREPAKVRTHVELVERIHKERENFDFTEFKYVPGHSRDFGNRMADRMVAEQFAAHEFPLLNTSNSSSVSDRERARRYVILKRQLDLLRNELDYSRTNPEPTRLQPGDRVTVRKRAYSSAAEGRIAKFEPRYQGEYVVVKRVSTNLYLIREKDESTNRVLCNIGQLQLIERSSTAVVPVNRIEHAPRIGNKPVIHLPGKPIGRKGNFEVLLPRPHRVDHKQKSREELLEYEWRREFEEEASRERSLVRQIGTYIDEKWPEIRYRTETLPSVNDWHRQSVVASIGRPFRFKTYALARCITRLYLLSRQGECEHNALPVMQYWINSIFQGLGNGAELHQKGRLRVVLV